MKPYQDILGKIQYDDRGKSAEELKSIGSAYKGKKNIRKSEVETSLQACLLL